MGIPFVTKGLGSVSIYLETDRLYVTYRISYNLYLYLSGPSWEHLPAMPHVRNASKKDPPTGFEGRKSLLMDSFQFNLYRAAIS